MKIIRINLVNLRNGEHHSLNDNCVIEVNKMGAGNLNMETLFGKYSALVALEGEAIYGRRKSIYSQQLADLGIEINETFRGWMDALKSAKHHYEAPKRAAAKRVWVLAHFFRDLPRGNYMERAGVIKSFVAQSRESHGVDLGFLGLSSWMDELEARDNMFEEIVSARGVEGREKPAMNMKDARIEVDKVYRMLLDYLEALMNVSPQPALETLINQLNYKSKSLRDIMAQRQGRAKAKLTHNAKAVIENQEEDINSIS